MRTLTYQVKSQRLLPTGDHYGLVAGSQGHLKAKFTFNEDWYDCVKVASFFNNGEEYAALLDENNECMIPTEALTNSTFEVCVEGRKDNYRILSSKIKERQRVVRRDD